MGARLLERFRYLIGAISRIFSFFRLYSVYQNILTELVEKVEETYPELKDFPGDISKFDFKPIIEQIFNISLENG